MPRMARASIGGICCHGGNRVPEAEREFAALRRGLRRGVPATSESWTRHPARRVGLEADLRPRGRPPKQRGDGEERPVPIVLGTEGPRAAGWGWVGCARPPARAKSMLASPVRLCSSNGVGGNRVSGSAWPFLIVAVWGVLVFWFLVSIKSPEESMATSSPSDWAPGCVLLILAAAIIAACYLLGLIPWPPRWPR